MLGPFDLWVVRSGGEAFLAWSTAGDELRERGFDDAPRPDSQPALLRVPEPGRIVLEPRTAPLSIVARPETPVSLAPGASLRAYVSTPLWLQMSTRGGAGPELAVQPLKHTWAGTTTDGSLCIATRTHLRLSLERLPRRAHRILSAIVLRNATNETVKVERLVLPLPLARLYADGDLLWSESITLVHKEGGTDSLLNGPPREAASAVQVAASRVSSSRGLTGVVSAVLAGIV
ncbi:MAG: hypothetical protein R3F61_36070 [Myxococcota bacterium]